MEKEKGGKGRKARQGKEKQRKKTIVNNFLYSGKIAGVCNRPASLFFWLYNRKKIKQIKTTVRD